MLSFLAQSDFDYTYTTTEVDAGGAAFFGGIMIVYLIILVAFVIAMWKVFTKAGEQGWKALIPVYNYWTLCEIAGRPGWWALLFIPVALLFWIPIVGFVLWLALVALSIIVSLDIGRAFKKSTTFSVVGLILFSIVGYLILGFGKDKYHGPDPIKLGDIDPKYTEKAPSGSSAKSKDS